MTGKLLQQLDALRRGTAHLEQSKSKKTTERPRVSEEAFRSFFNRVAEGVLFMDPEKGQFITGNKVICEIFGFDFEEIAKLEVTDIYPQKDLNHVKEQLEKRRYGKLAVIKNVLIKRRDGSFFWADITSVPFTLDDKTHLMCILRETPLLNVKSKLRLSTSTDSFASRHLTPTEITVLRLIVNGMSSKEIAQLLHRSTRTIQNHRAHLMNKLEVNNTIELIKKAIKMKVVELPGVNG